MGTWNVRNMSLGKLDVIIKEMERTNIDLLGMSELKWTGMGHFLTDDFEVFFCSHEE